MIQRLKYLHIQRFFLSFTLEESIDDVSNDSHFELTSAPSFVSLFYFDTLALQNSLLPTRVIDLLRAIYFPVLTLWQTHPISCTLYPKHDFFRSVIYNISFHCLSFIRSVVYVESMQSNSTVNSIKWSS